MDVVRPGPAGGDELVPDPARERDVGLVPAVYVADRTATHEEVRLAVLAGGCGDTRPARDLAPGCVQLVRPP